MAQAAQNGDGRFSSNSTPTIGWLDDAETRNLLSSLGLINEEGEWRTSFTMNPALDPAANIMQPAAYQGQVTSNQIGATAPMYGARPSTQQIPSLWDPRPSSNGNYLEGIDRGFHAVHNYSQYSL